MELISLRDLRNAAVGFIVVIGGIGLAALTLYAHRANQPKIAGVAAGLSLVFVLLILIFVVPPLARNASREASQLDLPFEFTMGGTIVIGLIAIVGFSAWNTGNNLLFLVLSFLAAAMIVGFFTGSAMLKKLDVKMRFPETIFAGEETPIFVSLNNRKRFLPSISVVAEVRGHEREESVAAADLKKTLPDWLAKRLSRAPLVRRTLDHFVYIPRSSSVENRTMHVFPHRGRMIIRDFEISTRFPFAFFRHRKRLSARETELIVFPRINPHDGEIERQRLDAGKLLANKRGSGFDLLTLRKYQPSDDHRRVDWKATARSKQLMVREFAAEDDLRITVFLDTRLPLDEAPAMTIRQKLEAEQKGEYPERSVRFEAAVSEAASLIAHFTEEQAEICLLTSDEELEFGVGMRHLHECLKKLAMVEPLFVPDGQSALPWKTLEARISGNLPSSIFIFSAFPEADIPEELTQSAFIVRY